MTSTPDDAWRQHAACQNADPEAFFPGGKDITSTQAAIAICRRCPVRDACLQYAIEYDERHGIWGGLTPEQRDGMHRRAAQELPLLARDPDGTGSADRRFSTWLTRRTPHPTIDEMRRSA
jgi:WhiB family redox-sensing transcriptional regulator